MATRRAPQNLERHITTHGDADDRESGRGGREEALGHRRHGVVTTVVGHDHRSKSPEFGQLLAVNPKRANKTRYEDNRQRISHLPFSN